MTVHNKLAIFFLCLGLRVLFQNASIQNAGSHPCLRFFAVFILFSFLNPAHIHDNWWDLLVKKPNSTHNLCNLALGQGEQVTSMPALKETVCATWAANPSSRYIRQQGQHSVIYPIQIILFKLCRYAENAQFFCDGCQDRVLFLL